jgi:hypothetical protein
MKNKKVIREQSSSANAGSTTIDLTQAVKLKCFDRFKWFVIDRGVQPVKTKTGKQVVSGKNKKGDTVFFYGDGNVTNVTANPKVTKKWSCSSLNQSDPIDPIWSAAQIEGSTRDVVRYSPAGNPNQFMDLYTMMKDYAGSDDPAKGTIINEGEIMNIWMEQSMLVIGRRIDNMDMELNLGLMF